MKIIHHRASPPSPRPSLDGGLLCRRRRHGSLAALLCSSAALLLRGRGRRESRFACASASRRPTAFPHRLMLLSTRVLRRTLDNPQQKLPEHAPFPQSIPALLALCLALCLSLSLTGLFFIPALLPLSVFCMSPPPSLVHLTLVTAVHHIHRFSDLSSVPDHLVLHLFQKILAAGKLTDYVLRMFVATGNDEVLQLVKALRIRPVTKPILPTRCSDKEF